MGALAEQLDYLKKELDAVRTEVGTARAEFGKELTAAKAEVKSAVTNWLDASDTNPIRKANLKEVWEHAMKNDERLQELAVMKEELFQKREERVHEHLKFLEDKEFALKKEELYQQREHRVHEHLKFLEDKLDKPNRR